MANVFISYRRSDSAAITGRIRDRLADYYGADAIFIDIDSIPLGIDFRQQIQEAITKNDLVLAVIGPKWIGSKKAGATRISDYKDPIRIEIETALNHGIPLIPVVVGGATMPKDSALPDSLQKLPFLNAAEVDDGRDFHQHVDRLIRAMDRLLTESKLASLGQKSVPITDVTASSRSRDDATPKEQLQEDRSVQDTSDPRKNAEFSSFFCEQTTASARVALLIGLVSVTLPVGELAPEQVPVTSAYRGLIGIPFILFMFAVFAATYSSLAQRYWQTFLLAYNTIISLALFSAAWLSYQNEPSFDLEKWGMITILAIANGVLFPLRFFNAAGYSVFVAGSVYLFLVLTNQSLLSTAWMQAAVGVALLVFCAVAYFREQQVWLLFQSRGWEQRHDRA
jgi:hypothetical protein